jgi:hypothetical protein
MQACRALYHLGVPILLRELNLTHPLKNSVWRRYLLTDPERSGHIQILECRYRDLIQPEAFVGFLTTKATNLRSLTVRFQDNDGLVSTPVIEWVSSLVHLRRIVLLRVPPDSYTIFSQLFGQIKAPLVAVTVEEMSELPLPDEPRHETVYPIPALGRFTATLQELVIGWNGTGTTLPSALSKEGIVFPLVRKLSWRSLEFINIGVLVDAFPALQDLRICYSNTNASPLFRHGDAYYEQYRKRNLDIQATKKWDSLQHVRGEAMSVWWLGLACPVRHITLTDTTGGANEAQIQEVLEAVQPESLEFGTLFHEIHLPDLSRIFAMCESLEELTLRPRVHRRRQEDMLYVITILVRTLPFLFPAVARLTLPLRLQESIFMNIEQRLLPSRLRRLTVHTPACFSDTAVAHPREQRFRDTWHRLALRVFYTIPGFERLKVCILGCEPLVWGVAGDASQVRAGGDTSVWGAAEYHQDVCPTRIVDQGPPGRVFSMLR